MAADANRRGPHITAASDSRITRAGAFLRRYKLDELPQLWNVLLGEMSLVGPRPEVPRYVAHYSADERKSILSVRPGITDPTSIAFARESELLDQTDDPERVYVEVVLPQKIQAYRQYVASRSILGDFVVMWRTLRVFVRPNWRSLQLKRCRGRRVS